MKTLIQSLAVCVLLFARTSFAADLGTAFTYQGSLENGSGPVTDTCDFRFGLWDASAAGNQKGFSPQTKTGVAVAGGVFLIESLDFGAAAINGTARWLELEVQCPGDAGFVLLTPRVELKPVPHALSLPGVYTQQGNNCCTSHATPGCADPACEAEVCPSDPFCCNTAWDNACAAAARSHLQCLETCTTGVGIGTDSVLAGLDVDTNAIISDTLTVFNSGGGLALDVIGDTQISYNLSVAGNALTVTHSNGRVGMGTNAPTAPVEVVGGYVQEFGQMVVRHSSGTPAYGWWGAGTNSVVFGANNIAASGGIEFRLGTGASTNQVMLIQPEGRVSINRNGASHPLQVGTNSTNGNGAHLTVGGVWTNGSDRNSKEDFEPIDNAEILSKVAELPITRWQYKGEDESIHHIGPVAQDFHAAFGLGGSDTHIGTLDVDGVALAAIQGLHGIVQEKDCEIAELKSRIERLEQLFNTNQGDPK